MIFVTVGTHEQSFDRLIKKVDELKGTGIITEEVFIQTGYSSYKPEHCKYKSMLSFAEMERMNKEARIVISHAGPSSFLAPLKLGKIPVVVPRTKQNHEHVNDHQVAFARIVAERQKSIILVEDIEKLGDVISDYDSISASMDWKTGSNNQAFLEGFEQIVDDLMKK